MLSSVIESIPASWPHFPRTKIGIFVISRVRNRTFEVTSGRVGGVYQPYSRLSCDPDSQRLRALLLISRIMSSMDSSLCLGRHSRPGMLSAVLKRDIPVDVLQTM